jgi:hypothetical protein
MATQNHIDIAQRAEFLRKLGVEIMEQHRSLILRKKEPSGELRHERRVRRDVLRRLDAYQA